MDNRATELLSVFDFESYRDFLKHAGLPDGLYQHSSNTLAKWAKRLGYKSPSSLTMILNGSRHPSFEMVNALTRDLNLKGKEKEYFELLVEVERKRDKEKDVTGLLTRLNELSGGKGLHHLDLKVFDSISKWYFIVLKQMVCSPGFVEDHDFLYKRLRKKVTKRQIAEAIDSMLLVGILDRDREGRLFVPEKSSMTSNDIPSAAIRSHHSGMLERAHDSLFEQEVEDRQISSVTFRMNEKKKAEAKAELFQFLKDFHQKYTDDLGDEIYQLNLQFFCHTKQVMEQ